MCKSRKWLIAGLLLTGALYGQDNCVQNPDSAMLLKRIAELTKQVDQLNMRAVMLRMQIAQKDEQLGFYMACAYAGIIPDGGCEVDAVGLTVTRNEKAKGKVEEKQK